MRPIDLGLATALAVVWGAPAIVLGQAAAPDESAYAVLIGQAVDAFNSRHWSQARDLFRRAHALLPNARTLRGIGLASMELGDPVSGLEALEAAVRDARRPLSDEQIREAGRLIDRARSLTARLVVRPIPATAVVRLDEAEPHRSPDGAIVVAPGHHTVTVSTPGQAEATRSIVAYAGENASIEVDLGATAAPRASSASDRRRSILRPMLVVGGGALLAGAVATLVVWIDRQGAVSECRAASSPANLCINGGSLEAEQNLSAAFTIGLGVVGAAAVALGLTLRFGPREERNALALDCTPAGIGVACAGRF